MSISYYDLAQDGEKFLSPHFQIKEFADPSDYERVPFPTTIPIHDKLPEILEKIYNNYSYKGEGIQAIDKQFFMHPYAGLRFEFEMTTRELCQRYIKP